MAAYGREKLHLNIKTGSIEAFATTEKFDLVNLIQVIGHVYDPDKALRNVAQLLKRNGLVLVESWNRSSCSARILGKRWHEYSPPSIIHCYSDKTLALLFNYHGFKLIAKGYPVKKISVHHALFFLEGKTSNKMLKKLFGWAKRVSVTRRLAFMNPLFDVKWYVFQKSD
jgi:SAM-dependent methyltransferase